jgi:hypothetical protein
MKVSKIKFEKFGLSHPFYFQKLFKLKIHKNKNKSYNSESKELNLFNNISEIKKVNDNPNNNKEIKSEKNKYLFKNKNKNNKNIFCKKLSIKNNSTINFFKKNYNIFGDYHQNQRITIDNFNINKNISKIKKNENNIINSNDVFENYNIKNIDFPDIIKHKKEYKTHYYKFKNKNEFLKKNNDKFKKYDLIMNNLRLKFHGNILFNRKLKDIISKDKNLFRKRNSSFIINIEKEFDSYSKEADDKFSSFTLKQKCNFTNELIKNSLSERKNELF